MQNFEQRNYKSKLVHNLYANCKNNLQMQVIWRLMMEIKHNIKREDQQLRNKFSLKHKMNQESSNNRKKKKKERKNK